MRNTTTYVRLSYASYRTEFDDSDRAKVFGELVKLALPTVQAYHSDLYHDAQWVRENVVGQGSVFYFGVRDSGTSISKSQAEVEAYNTHVWSIVVRTIGGMATMEVTPLYFGREV